ncbi:MAG: hypothetical protein BWY38_03152 [Ignavibacteria bacterium ADurb.Bin266]|nr:MAG: hypothetical protein BWY38_03152 [Ignavibacteria bacterium ADurb.Bin266]
MKKKLKMKNKLSLILLILIQFNSLSQSLWDKLSVPLEYNQIMNNDTTLLDLETIVYNKEENIINLKYIYAVRELVDKYKTEKREFLLLNLLTVPDTVKLITSDSILYELWYWAFENDMIARGYLGDLQAVDGMKYLRDNPKGTDQVNLTAIYYLTRVGIYEDYQTILNLVNDSGYSPCYLRYFIEDPDLVVEIKNILLPIIKYNSKTEYDFIVSCSLEILSQIDSVALNEALEWGFNNNVGRLKLWFFNQVGKYNKEYQPSLSKIALLSETDVELLSYYLPSVYDITYKNVSPKYSSPNWINFLNEFSNSMNYDLLKKRINYFKTNFIPINDIGFSNFSEYIDFTSNLVDTTVNYNWLGDLTFSNELKSILTTAKTNLQNGDSLACRVQIKEFQDLVDNVYKDSLNTDPRFVTIEGWKFLYWNAQYILDRLPEPQTNPNLLVNLKNSLGNQIPANNVMYYEGSWKDAVNNGDGTFTVITSKPTVSIRMFYEYANQTVNNVPAQNNTYTFTTVNASVQLKNSSGNLIDEGTVQYYAGAWRSFGTTINGVAYKELLPVNYSFRMTYEYVLNDKQQNLSENPVVDFNTVLCTIKVTNANNQPLEGANTKYYSIAWRDIGLTNSSGEITKELLPKNLSFRATYNNVSRDKQQDISVNNLVEIMLNVP